VKHSCTDEFKSLTVIADVLSIVSESLVAASMPPAVQIAAAEMLHAFASAHGNRPSMLDLSLDPYCGGGGGGSGGGGGGRTARGGGSLGASLGGVGSAPPPPSPRAFFTNQKLVQRSGCVRHCVAGLGAAVASGDAAAQLAITRVLLEASYYDENAQQIADEGLFLLLAPLLRDDFRCLGLKVVRV
jgi:hypothetical protein